jgi:pyrophosphate--fructose-6-phosphate 1-phosphotransferase
MSCVLNLKEEVEQWVPCGYPLVSMMHVERRNGKDVPVIRKALTELNGPLF